MVYEKSWVQAWLGFGLVWFLGAIALAPSNKLYQQGLVVFLWVPMLLLAWPARRVLVEAWRRQPALWGSIVLLMVWGLISLAWTSAEDAGREAKRLLYILVFLLAFPVLAQAGSARVRQLLQLGGALLALAALLSIVHFYVMQAMPLTGRLAGIGGISHPILGAYVVAAGALLLLYQMPRQRLAQVGWLLALACLGAFVVLSQSRGAVLSLLFTVLLAPLWCRDRLSRVIAVMAIATLGLAICVMYDLLTARGTSFRPQIFEVVLGMISAHPWGGLGLGSAYSVSAVGLVFDHSHNMFTHVALELGLPGMVLWTAVWLFALSEIVRARHSAIGKILLGLWVFSTMAMQFDAASLTATPRAEWFVSWLPVALVMWLPWIRAENNACGKISGST
ncbi:O-antigen ligase family protein [Pseudomonas fluorescens]|jgi:O-antigen ligase|uniref:O-antigen ligase family protein n=1 Tax=Pseudomonas fluorescens TaxID=294 RepID=UPI0020C45BD2|nr:O-antigen ligase family protein [Pseudomonas fluorescens]UTL91628.1 O-antigen ligase family protein [Pseudomonas fluorescens]